MMGLGALLLAMFAITTEAHNHGEKFRGKINKEEWKNHHHEGKQRNGMNWHDRMFAIKDTMNNLGYTFQWEPVNELGRSIIFTSPSSIMCYSPSINNVKDTDYVVVVTTSETESPLVKTYKCSDDKAYLTTGKGEITLDFTINTNAHAMLLVESGSNTETNEKYISLLSSTRYAAPSPSSTTTTTTETTTEERKLSGNETTNPTGPATCGAEGLPACETAEEKKTDEKVQEGEANFALAVAFFGCVAIVRAANKYARDPS